MKSIKMALMAGAAIAVSAAAAQADDLEALKAQIETLNARVAAMEAAPSVPAGYSLLAISDGARVNTPGLEMSAREKAGYGDEATVISVLPTADAPAGTTITWSGYARAGLVYSNSDYDLDVRDYNRQNGQWVRNPNGDFSGNSDDNDDIDVKARGQLRVTASTDTAVGEVGVDLRLRGNFNGNGDADVYMDVAWGYWAMTPELSFGGGYADSLGQLGYGYDGACTCYYTDNAGVAFDPGDTTQMRLTYASGPFSMAIALEDASIRGGGDDFYADDTLNGDRLGAAGEIKYTGDTISGEIAGVWRDVNEDEYTLSGATLGDLGIDSLWQIGAGIGFSLGDVASLSLAAAMGEGPFYTETEGQIVDGLPYNQNWWGVSALASFNLTDEVHAELGAGYKNREGDDFDLITGQGIQIPPQLTRYWESDGADYDTYAILAGIYYDPVDQLTIGIEGEWYTTETSFDLETVAPTGNNAYDKKSVDYSTDNWSIDLVSVWRF